MAVYRRVEGEVALISAHATRKKARASPRFFASVTTVFPVQEHRGFIA
ncbi:hypothetical protein PAMC26577_03615 [Caballeronia sordidicola]|uniref:Uncharacterized protein n=1 Tax=Caballeronia sordidicola TaxID=196367 RepID=A0A242N4U0_CABSO|nr:hypothetical protein PAMC26577_03615 [Caballeronia sordidicola]